MAHVRAGHVVGAIDDAGRARHPARALHPALGPDRAHASGVAPQSGRPCVRVGAVRDGPARAARPRHHHARDALRRAGLGERRTSRQLAAEERLRGLRVCGIEALSVGAPLDGLERAERTDVRRAGVADRVREAAAQPGVRIAPPGELRERRRRRRDLAAANGIGDVAARVHDGHQGCAAAGSMRTRRTRIRCRPARRRSTRRACIAR